MLEDIFNVFADAVDSLALYFDESLGQWPDLVAARAQAYAIFLVSLAATHILINALRRAENTSHLADALQRFAAIFFPVAALFLVLDALSVFFGTDRSAVAYVNPATEAGLAAFVITVTYLVVANSRWYWALAPCAILILSHLFTPRAEIPTAPGRDDIAARIEEAERRADEEALRMANEDFARAEEAERRAENSNRQAQAKAQEEEARRRQQEQQTRREASDAGGRDLEEKRRLDEATKQAADRALAEQAAAEEQRRIAEEASRGVDQAGSGALDDTEDSGRGYDVAEAERDRQLREEPEKAKLSVTVYFGTDRRRILTGDRWTFGSTRGRKLSLGAATITIPANHVAGRIESPKEYSVFGISIYKQAADPKEHFVVKDLQTYTPEELLKRVAADPRRKSALVFVHGFNVHFDAALFRTAQIAYDLKFEGIPYLYSWPSSGGIKNYVADLANAEQSQFYLRDFLQLVVRDTGAENIYLIAHSMGNQPLMRVMQDLADSMPDNERKKVRQVVLASPDIDEAVFEQLASAMTSFGGATVYASGVDRAMDASRLIGGNDDIRRAGGVTNLGPVVVPGVDTIDATAASMDWFSLNHSAYAESGALLGDISALLQCGLRPPTRRSEGFEIMTGTAGKYWKLKPGPYQALAGQCPPR